MCVFPPPYCNLVLLEEETSLGTSLWNVSALSESSVKSSSPLNSKFDL